MRNVHTKLKIWYNVIYTIIIYNHNVKQDISVSVLFVIRVVVVIMGVTVNCEKNTYFM